MQGLLHVHDSRPRDPSSEPDSARDALADRDAQRAARRGPDRDAPALAEAQAASTGDAREGELSVAHPHDADDARASVPIELAIAEDTVERQGREFIAELVDVRDELNELFDSDE